MIICPVLRSDGSNAGGATISANYFTEFLRQKKIPLHLVDTKYFSKGILKILNPFYVVFSFFKNIWNTDVVFVSVSQFGVKTIAPILFILTKLFNRKFVFRPFGGAMRDHYEEYSFWQKSIFNKTLLQSDIFFLQTQQLINFFSPLGKNVKQLKTSRNAPDTGQLRGDREYQKRFIFLGHIKESKGVDTLLHAAKILDDDYTIHLYGHIHEEKYHTILRENKYYKGILQKEKVLSTLAEYDVLLLPSHYRGEGYAGAVIEAYSVGLPVIVSDWRALPEIVEADRTGKIIPIKNTAALVKAMQAFNKKNFSTFSQNARLYYQNNFVADVISEYVIQEIEAL